MSGFFDQNDHYDYGREDPLFDESYTSNEYDDEWPDQDLSDDDDRREDGVER